MKTIVRGAVVGLILALLCGIAAAEEQKGVDVDCHKVKSEACFDLAAHPLPASPEEAKALRDEVAKDPWGGAAMLVYALMVWQQDEKLGEQLLVLAMSEKRVKKAKGSGTYGGYDLTGSIVELLRTAKSKKHCLRSYAVGATPDNDYAIPDAQAVVLRFRKQEKWVGSIESGTYKVFVCTSGADTCRPVTATVNKNGVWKADEVSSLFGGCRPMKSQEKPKADDDAADAL